MKPDRSAGIFIAVMVFMGAGSQAAHADGLVIFQAESGVLGSNFTNGTDGVVQFISISTDTVNSGNPGNANRVATYSVTFPSAGTYKLYGRVRVGPGGANDDSFFYGNGFGAKSATADADWILNNNVNVGGFTSSSDVVSGSGSAGVSVWKWINFSDYTGAAGETPISFTVTTGNLTQTFQIGARENGFDMDKFAFGTAGTAFTVSNLDTGTHPPPPP
jgi:endo-1,4-beta-xylanase